MKTAIIGAFIGVFIGVLFFAPKSTYATTEVCFCHNVNNNPITICTSNQGQINGHWSHVNNGQDYVGRCQTSTPSPSLLPSATPTSTEEPYESPTPSPTYQPTASASAQPSVDPTATPIPTEVPGTPRTDLTDGRSDGRVDQYSCTINDCNTHRGEVLGLSLPSTGSHEREWNIFWGFIGILVGFAIKRWADGSNV